jgi:hypothetical protein
MEAVHTLNQHGISGPERVVSNQSSIYHRRWRTPMLCAKVKEEDKCI